MSYLIFIIALIRHYYSEHICYLIEWKQRRRGYKKLEQEKNVSKPHPFNDDDSTEAHTKLKLTKHYCFFIFFLLNLVWWFIMAALFFCEQYIRYNEPKEIETSVKNMTEDIKRLEATSAAAYFYSHLCTIISCFIFSKIMYGIQRKINEQKKNSNGIISANNNDDEWITIDIGERTITGGRNIITGRKHTITGGTNIINGGQQHTIAGGSNTINYGEHTITGGTNIINGGKHIITNGSNNINDGKHTITSGSNTINGGTNTITNGSNTINGGVNDIYRNCRQNAIINGGENSIINDDGARIVERNRSKIIICGRNSHNIDDGYSTIICGTNSINDGSNIIRGGTNSINNGYNIIRGGTNCINNGCNIIEGGTNNINNGYNTINNGTNTINNGYNTIRGGTNNINGGYNTITCGTNSINNGSNTIHGGTNSIYGGSNTVYDGTNSIYCGSNTVYDGINSIYGGSNEEYTTVNNKKYTQSRRTNDGSKLIDSGINIINGGRHTIKGGLNTINGGEHIITGGSNTIYGGTNTIKGGLNTIKGGKNNIRGGINSIHGTSGKLQLLIEADKTFLQCAKKTLSYFQFWFFIHWLFYIITSFLTIALSIEAILLDIRGTQHHIRPGVHFSDGEMWLLAILSFSNVLMFIYPCFQAASITRARKKYIRYLTKKYAKSDQKELVDSYVKYLQSRDFGFRLNVGCTHIPFNLNVAYTSILIGAFGIVLSVLTSVAT